MLWWRQYLNPSATMGRWCTIKFPGWQWRFTFGKMPKSLSLDQTNTQRLSSSWIWWNRQCGNALMATATVFKSICYYGKMMHNRISGVTMALYHDLNFMGHLNITWCGVPFLMKFSTFWWENRPFLYESHLIFRPLTAPAITTAVHKSLRPIDAEKQQ